MRRQMRAARAGLVADRENASARAAALAPLDLWPSTPVVAAYLALETEIDPAPLLDRLVAAGARVVLPVVIAPGEPMVFRETVAKEALQPDAAGLAAPPATSPALRPNLVLAPLLAFDREGGRLGQGGGYYDRTLRILRVTGPVWVVGLAFAGQEIGFVPMDAHDERLDAILTEKGYSVF